MTAANPKMYGVKERFQDRAFDPVLWGKWFGHENYYSPKWSQFREGVLSEFPNNTKGVMPYKKQEIFRTILDGTVLMRAYMDMPRLTQCAEDIGESIHSLRTYQACMYPRMAVQTRARHAVMNVIPGRCNVEGQYLQRDIFEGKNWTKSFEDFTKCCNFENYE